MEIDITQRYIILDTDMGTDDAWALFLLVRVILELSNVKLLALTCGYANTSLKYSVRNAYRFLNAMNRTGVKTKRNAFIY